MLSEREKQALEQKSVYNFDDIESYDAAHEIVTMKNGEKRQLTEVWTRVMGYFRPSSAFNLGKRSEYEERKYFKLGTAMKHCEMPMAAE